VNHACSDDPAGFLCRTSLLIVEEIGYLPVIPGGGNLFFQLVNARYERAAMIHTSNRGFAEWGEVFGDPVVASALLDRFLHHALVIQIEGHDPGFHFWMVDRGSAAAVPGLAS